MMIFDVIIEKRMERGLGRFAQINPRHPRSIDIQKKNFNHELR
jgi:hypothetical protein